MNLNKDIRQENLLDKNLKELSFIKDIAKYFMDFLETDFHKRKLPRRSVKYRNNDNLLIGINLDKYPEFHQGINKTIKNAFGSESLKKIDKNQYKTSLPKNLLDLIFLQIKKINQAQLNKTQKKLAESIERAATLHKKEHDKAQAYIYDDFEAIISKDLIHPFIENIEKPLENLDLGDEEHIFVMTEELVEIIFTSLKSKASEILNLLIAKEKVNVNKELGEVFSLEEIQENLSSYFGELKINDLFSEIFQLEKNKKILDKQDLYLYIGDISFESKKYPIFYIPIETRIDSNSVQISYDSQLYVNKKALNYICQEFNNLKNLKGSLDDSGERIIYLSQQSENLIEKLTETIDELKNYFDIKGEVDLVNDKVVDARSQYVKISNNRYLCLFDKSDEALVNDYEEILTELNQEGGTLGDKFKELLASFIHKNPVSYNPEIENEWDDTETEDKLVYSSPIPLNSEQRQILKSISKKDCNYLSVSGPPGTGKSHTITAIVFDAILKDKSVLVLSDKKEALDVVEDIITQTMNKVRYAESTFRNPILRLGKTGSTYSEILSRSSLDNIKNHHRAVKSKVGEIDQQVKNIMENSMAQIDHEISTYDEIELKEITEFQDLESHYENGTVLIDQDEFKDNEDLLQTFTDLVAAVVNIKEKIDSPEAKEIIKAINKAHNQGNLALTHSIEFLKYSKKITKTIDDMYALNTMEFFSHFDTLNEKDIAHFDEYITSYLMLKGVITGYLFKKKDVKALNENLNSKLTSPVNLEFNKELDAIKDLIKINTLIKNQFNNTEYEFSGETNLIFYFHALFSKKINDEKIDEILSIEDDSEIIKSFISHYPSTAKRLNLDLNDSNSITNNDVLLNQQKELEKELRFIYLDDKISDTFNDIPESQYQKSNEDIESLITAQVTHQMDDRLIHFFENNKNDATTLRNIIRGKQRFPKDQFLKLKNAFPCILAGIRDYAEYIPLETEIFDLVIIDEASQVSLAQAFPALLRARKVLVLGDKKQFSNVKSAQARSDTNREYLNALSESFKKNVSTDLTKIERLKKFNIKTSILDFFEYISNYSIQLMKHFRGYKEIISYSNRYFYDNSLQVMKILGKPVTEVLKFTYVDPKDEDETYPNTNLKEVNFICDELVKLRNNNSRQSIGIITPHTNQQKLLIENIANLIEWNDLQDINNIKIMTFDTCQGEERDIIFYSMVASKTKDKLWGIFIKDLKNVDLEEDGQIKAQRLNVGFSRAKETMHFVCSKPVTDFSGSIGEALRHYENILTTSSKEKSTDEVDKNSKMEEKVLEWFYQTEFWKDNKDQIEFNPQFEIGEYLKQLDRNYSYPSYVVDFLISYKLSDRKIKQIILEYDGFKEHFSAMDMVNEGNYQDYYNEDDVYRQKVLEGYGYQFIRINRFNVGKDPVETLNSRIENLIKESPAKTNILQNIASTVSDLNTGDKKECPKCKKIRESDDFSDESLESGYGRFCKYCKATKSRKRKKSSSTSSPAQPGITCPDCGGSMRLRNGKYGEFYGCAKFPYCKGTRNL